jgi:signal transduction histidine kinase
MVIVLGATRFAAYTPESAAIANRFVPALTAAFAGGSSEPVEAVSSNQNRSNTKTREYVESIASATELVSACGVVATQITNLTGASRVQIGFIEEETGLAHLGFDTEASDDYLDIARIGPGEFEMLNEVDSERIAGTSQRYSIVRTAIKVSDRVIGYVEAKHDTSGFDKSDVVKIHEITSACAPVVATLKQLELSERTLKKLEMLRRVIDQIRSEKTDDPIHSPRIASLIRNLFDADWIYFGSVDHENDYSTTEITDGVDVPELAAEVRVSRRSLLIPSTLAASGPVAIDLESAAPGQRASGRWMYRAGLRSAICAPLHLNGVVTTMFMCAARKPNGFGSLEKKLAAAIVSELELSIERAVNSESLNRSDHEKGSAQLVIEQLGPNLHSILNNASALVLTIDKNGIVTEVAGRGIKGLNLVPERLLGRDFITYSRKIAGLEEALKRALNGHSDRIEIEIFGTVLDAWMEPAVAPNGDSGSATVVVSDITDRVTAERSESALKRVKEEQDRASKFIVSLSHEMKAPLTTVVALADLLGMNDRGNLHPDQIERIQVVQQNADRLTLLVNDFLNISKMEAGTFKAKPSKFQISELAHDLKASFEPIANGQDHNLDVTAPDEHQFATADRELLRQAIINLLSNASKYSPPNTNIALDIWVDERDLRITVTDEGHGIPHDERDMVFEPYKQLDNPDVPGTGMGLTIVRQIVELHGGKVWVEDGGAGGSGTSFAVWLPDAVTNN